MRDENTPTLLELWHIFEMSEQFFKYNKKTIISKKEQAIEG